MKKVVLFSTLALCVGASFAQQETARVISVTPNMQQVSVPRQVCSNESVMTTPQKSGAGAAMGAIAGGAMGNSVGGGSGRAAATMIGIIGGAILGDKIEGQDAPQVQNVQRCSIQHIMENRIVNYHVVYEFGGKQYSVQMPYDPGASIKLQLTPISAAQSDSQVAAVVPNVPVYPAYTPTVVAQDSYPVVVQRPYNPSVVIMPSLYLGYTYGNFGHRRWH